MFHPLRHLLFCLVVATIAPAAFAPAALAQEQPAAPKVSVAAAYTQDIIDSAEFIGRAEAIDRVDIIARVSGFLRAREVQDGAAVAKDDLLFEIEPDLYEATLAARQADLERANANVELAQVDFARKEELFKRGSVPESERDLAFANKQVAEAEVKAANAAIRSAELDLSYTMIHAPFEGRAGRIGVSVGDLVGPATAPLVSIVREAPIYVSFSLSEKQFVDIVQQIGAQPGRLPEGDGPEVRVRLPNGQMLDEVGEIAFADNRVDPATGTITIRATFENADGLLIDGAFLGVEIAAQEPETKVLIPQAAIQRDQRGDFVLVVNASQMVEQRYITTGEQIETAIVVEEGLEPGESVIVEGLQRVRPGVAVDAVTVGN